MITDGENAVRRVISVDCTGKAIPLAVLDGSV